MTATSLRESQLAMARYLRNPDREPAPAGVEQRRLQVYQRLVYNNIERFISGGFPVLRSLYNDDDWQPLVREFIHRHQCQTPYFLEISQEFIQFLLHEHALRDCDPPFMAELAHYEWVELALDVSEEAPPRLFIPDNILTAVPHLSPLAWVLSYRYPVHRIGPGFQPTEVAEPTYLAVYRDHREQVKFLELNAATARLLEMIRDNTGANTGELLTHLAAELAMPEESVLAYGVEQVEKLIEQAVLGAAGEA